MQTNSDAIVNQKNVPFQATSKYPSGKTTRETRKKPPINTKGSKKS
jgi:hypothetical protein